jgi:hypothetical protein
LIRFLHTLGIPIVATIRDSQNYARAAELGVGVHEMKRYVAGEDVEQWLPLVDWLTRPRGTPAAPPPAPTDGTPGTAASDGSAPAAPEGGRTQAGEVALLPLPALALA